MEYYPTLHELLENSAQSRALFARFSRDAQVALQHQKQSIHTYADLKKTALLFEETPHWR